MSKSYQGFKRESPINKNFATIITECHISEAFDPTIIPHPKTIQYNALWDTGATNTVITKKVATELNLIPRGKITSFHADGQTNVETYYINILLPNNVGFQYLRVSEGKLKDFDVLIGMDIIAQGEFTLIHENYKHVFEFKLPAPKTIINDSNSNNIPKVGRNDKCPCGSGRKYKHCHGA
ncbi:SEC-C metal-binding domain-containing protein [Mucilaginibacter sp. X4EP1]|uniref:SEC-C metal-binding domain-containing protein n=1 Tax=Mucilaginibacter sp. X4EP1 TaxID=2723092 RepID=UPI0021685B48|nr:SEC-C metal-binding domain-containing protein [Mucilaginibacter sp. X4EP1]MCS3812937.1 putative aspartyl protease [Mucilaginibacter sp. X4EP1]